MAYRVAQHGGVGVDGLGACGPVQGEQVVHVHVGGGEPPGLQAAEKKQ